LRKRWPRQLQMLNLARPKRQRLHLDTEQYNQLRQQILQRDSWRCQLCGARSNLEAMSGSSGIGDFRYYSALENSDPRPIHRLQKRQLSL